MAVKPTRVRVKPVRMSVQHLRVRVQQARVAVLLPENRFETCADEHETGAHQGATAADRVLNAAERGVTCAGYGPSPWGQRRHWCRAEFVRLQNKFQLLEALPRQSTIDHAFVCIRLRCGQPFYARSSSYQFALDWILATIEML
jgi:hypothetical protein